MKEADIIALAEAVLDDPQPDWAKLVREMRNESHWGLKEAIGMARFALTTLAKRNYPHAQELLDRMPVRS